MELGLMTLVGQATVGVVFVLASVADLLDRNALLQLLRTKKLRYEEYLMYGAIALKFICGLALIFNIAPHVAAFFLAGFTLIANVIFHPFWWCAAADRKKEYFAFMVHMALIGGLLVIAGR